MTSLLIGLLRGTAAGAAGTTALNVTTQADMALRARPASDAPTATVSALADRVGAPIAGRRRERRHRLRGLGGLGGTASGLGVGAVAGLLRAAGVRLPGVLGGPLLGAAAMAATDLPMMGLGITDPRRWDTSEWVADALPHLVYGVTTHATLAATFRADERERVEHPMGTRRPAPVGTLVRAGAVGAATGCRSTVGLAALAWRARRDDPGLVKRLAGPWTQTTLGLLAAAELGADKHPSVPPRTSTPGLAPRLALAATSAEAMTRRDQREGGPAVLVATGAAAAAAVAGTRMRAAAGRRWGSDLPGALLEDAATALLAWFGTRRPPRIPH